MFVPLYLFALFVSSGALSDQNATTKVAMETAQKDGGGQETSVKAVDPNDVETHARNAREAASSATQAARVANAVAADSIDITHHAQSALKHARNALHGARVDTSGLSADQKESLRKAEEKLQAATHVADYGSLKDGRFAGKLGVSREGEASAETDRDRRTRGKLDKLQDKLDAKGGGKVDKEADTEEESIKQTRKELRILRERLAAKKLDSKELVDTKGTVSTKDDVSVTEMEAQLRDLETLVKRRQKEGYKPKPGEPTVDEIKAEMEHLRHRIADVRTEEEARAAEEAAKAKDPEAIKMTEAESEKARLEARLSKLEKLRANRAKEAEIRAALEKLRAMKAAGEPIPAGAPTEEELEALLRKLEAEDAALEKELGLKPGEDISGEIEILQSKLRMKRTGEYGEEYGHLSLDVGERKKTEAKGGTESDESVDLDETTSGDHLEGSDTKVLDADRMVKMGKGAFDIDTEMPYGELEPFGREDTAQELTESSIKESDEMVDQLERAEVAEEKRSVFRALTRLRGAAITSFDGIARSQTGNIDEYNKTHKWRKTHPLHHLADEESDISKWAFPDNADF